MAHRWAQSNACVGADVHDGRWLSTPLCAGLIYGEMQGCTLGSQGGSNQVFENQEASPEKGFPDT